MLAQRLDCRSAAVQHRAGLLTLQWLYLGLTSELKESVLALTLTLGTKLHSLLDICLGLLITVPSMMAVGGKNLASRSIAHTSCSLREK